MADDQADLSPEEAGKLSTEVSNAVLAVRRLIQGCAAAGMDVAALAAGCMVVAGEIAEAAAIPAEASEETAVAWFKQGRMNMAAFEAMRAAQENGGRLNG
jgi:hypothetical protein